MKKNVLLINDLAGYGKVALSAMIPVLSGMGCASSYLPTALVSNTLDYGKFNILETTNYMRECITNWKALGFHFDAVSTGFLLSVEQAGLVRGYCAEERALGSKIFVDPIMGDEGSLYPGIGDESLSAMKLLVGISDYTVPNYTEACFLTGTPYAPEGVSSAEAEKLLHRLLALGAKNIVITSAKVDGQDATIVYDYASGETRVLPFTYIPVRFPGTGDIFSSLFMGGILGGKDIFASAQGAMDKVYRLIELNKDKEDTFAGIAVENFLEVFEG